MKPVPHSKSLFDFAFKIQILIEELKADQTLRGYAAVDKILAQAVEALRVFGEGPVNQSGKSLERVLAQLAKVQGEVLGKEVDRMVNTAEKAAKWQQAEEAKFLRELTKTAVRKTASDALVQQVLKGPLHATGDLLEPFLKNWSKRQITKTAQAVRIGWAQGKTVAQITRDLLGTAARNKRDGLTSQLRRDTKAVVHTAMQQVSSMSRQALYEENAGLIVGYQYVATLDGATSAICRSLDGNKYKVGAGPMPPMHIHCRSTTIPELSSEFDFLDEGAVRSSENGYVAGKLSYYDWLKQQPASFQDDVLGPERGKIFRDSGLTPKQFSDLQLDKSFKPVTIEELEKRAARLLKNS